MRAAGSGRSLVVSFPAPSISGLLLRLPPPTIAAGRPAVTGYIWRQPNAALSTLLVASFARPILGGGKGRKEMGFRHRRDAVIAERSDQLHGSYLRERLNVHPRVAGTHCRRAWAPQPQPYRVSQMKIAAGNPRKGQRWQSWGMEKIARPSLARGFRRPRLRRSVGLWGHRENLKAATRVQNERLDAALQFVRCESVFPRLFVSSLLFPGMRASLVAAVTADPSSPLFTLKDYGRIISRREQDCRSA
ncbi:hypothetical protein BDY21DRAFT_4267 [Lineolata rhizophorae]|uniref:Uncharacterized protein n=1 Tax=Lineolata rhizophorae TaxID=578093 RepID=A0A6A6PD78_9PEZI|nr:hypothetical protein BDY21DRAFT_4267 [Lineolata rhizophorae]